MDKMDIPPDDYLDHLIKETYDQSTPVDSWQALRQRIDQRLSQDLSSTRSTDVRRDFSSGFWRQTALVLAACLVVAVGLILYLMGLDRPGLKSPVNALATEDYRLFSPVELQQRWTTFAEVQQLFPHQSQWIMVGMEGEAEMGIEEAPAVSHNHPPVIIVRLAVSREGEHTPPRYFDIITFAQRDTRIMLPVSPNTSTGVSLSPALEKDGRIRLCMKARIDNQREAAYTTVVSQEAFTHLLRVPVGDHWIQIAGIALQLTPRAG
jgi:hypothetical protein